MRHLPGSPAAVAAESWRAMCDRRIFDLRERVADQFGISLYRLFLSQDSLGCRPVVYHWAGLLQLAEEYLWPQLRVAPLVFLLCRGCGGGGEVEVATDTMSCPQCNGRGAVRAEAAR